MDTNNTPQKSSLSVKLISEITEASIQFEDSFNLQKKNPCFLNFIDQDKVAQVNLEHVDSLFQSHLFWSHKKNRFVLLQISNEKQIPVFNCYIEIKKNRINPWLKRGNIRRLPEIPEGFQEEEILSLILAKCKELGFAELRIQIERWDSISKSNSQERIFRLGGEPILPDDAWRTTAACLKLEEETIFNNMAQKTRASYRGAEKSTFIFKQITDEKYLNDLHEAHNASFARTEKKGVEFNFEELIQLAKHHPHRVQILGAFNTAKDPDKLLAFGIAINHKDITEYFSAGSVMDPDLRKISFNIYLAIQQIYWAKKMGSKIYNMGGITSGDDSDPLKGISGFKRKISRFEFEPCSEYIFTFKPKAILFFKFSQWLLGKLRP